MKYKLVALLILTELLIMVVLLDQVLIGKTYKTTVVSLDTQNAIFSKDSSFPYFREPKPFTLHKMKLEEIPETVAKINADSLNDRFNYAVEKPRDTFRIVTLGDSFTYGLYVNTPETYPERLEDRLNNLSCEIKFEVINLGMWGYDIAYAAERFRLRGQKYKPDLVLWFLQTGNFLDINEIRLPKMAVAIQKGVQEKKISYPPTENDYRLLDKKITAEINKTYREEEILRYQRLALATIHNSYDKPLVVFSSSNLEKKFQYVIKTFAEKNQNTYYTTIESLHAPSNVLPDGHTSSKGYDMISQELVTYLIKSRIAPCY